MKRNRRAVSGLLFAFATMFMGTGCTGDAGQAFRDAFVDGVATFIGATTVEILDVLFPVTEVVTDAV